ncbi:DUF6868 family protein [Arenimonas terrae]|jgi:hypothetical protein|uniref:DUF6868 domain-containing protein n=1 Tax=Arenimonas terrae TaxID=2546226 RepID=A0A5C4RPF7_9GAMM|nr:hypothetical protein [Arenimonas terrae]TNJ32978.1 hypothetical protein E1B00_11720 [Arenimonas terrae]
MDLSLVQTFLLYCAAINYGILLLWFAVFTLAHDAVYRLHTRWFRLSRESFDALNYGGVAVYKIGIMLFVLVPLLAVTLMKT